MPEEPVNTVVIPTPKQMWKEHLLFCHQQVRRTARLFGDDDYEKMHERLMEIIENKDSDKADLLRALALAYHITGSTITPPSSSLKIDEQEDDGAPELLVRHVPSPAKKLLTDGKQP